MTDDFRPAELLDVAAAPPAEPAPLVAFDWESDPRIPKVDEVYRCEYGHKTATRTAGGTWIGHAHPTWCRCHRPESSGGTSKTHPT